MIIPTYNRKQSVLRTLESLAQQTFPMDKLEVIVVDDGSTDDTSTLASQQFPFAFHLLRQKNQGATAARNYGARTSQSEILVFMDDDVTISAETLEAFAEKLDQITKVLLMGTIKTRTGTESSVYSSVALTMADHALIAGDDLEFNSVDCNTELLACRRSDFFSIGMFQDPTQGNGWPNWDDVDFGYRAHLQGYRLLGTSKAMADHWDYSVANHATACHRYYRAGRSAVWLLNRHPKLQALIPMLTDKTPLSWRQDSPSLMARKLARHIVSTKAAQAVLARLVHVLEQYYPSPRILRRLYYLMQGANLFQGYRAGLRDFKMNGAQG